MRASPFLALAALALTGCAKGPANGGVRDYTRLSFRFRMADAVVTGSPPAFTSNYRYLVAIRPLFLASDPPSGGDAVPGNTNTVDDGYGPVPVYTITTSNPKNGFVEGRPTRYVVYDPDQGTLYQIKGFGTRKPTALDDNPVDLANIVDKGFPIANVDPTTSGDPNTLGFDIQTRDLVDDVANAQKVYAIQFNIIATNEALTSGTSGRRVVDSLGDQTQLGVTGKGYYRAIIVTSGTYSSVTAQNEVTGDTLGGNLPAVDIASWSLSVATP